MSHAANAAPEWVPSARKLLRRSREGALATQSVQLAGFPYASWLPYACDETASPLFVISRLAEHTQNLLADGRSSLLVYDSTDDAVAAERVTLVGIAQPVAATPLLMARLQRYQPQAAQFLALGDFSVWRLQVEVLRYIAGFGRMGWSNTEQWQAAPVLSLEDEHALLSELAPQSEVSLIGVDFDGMDVHRNGRFIRYAFDTCPTDIPALREAVLAQLRAG